MSTNLHSTARPIRNIPATPTKAPFDTSEREYLVGISRDEYTVVLNTSPAGVSVEHFMTNEDAQCTSKEYYDNGRENEPTGNRLVIELDDELLGAELATTNYDPTHAHLDHLKVDPEARGRGFGTLLTDMFLGICAASPIKTVSMKFANNGGEEFLESYGLGLCSCTYYDPGYEHESVVVSDAPDMLSGELELADWSKFKPIEILQDFLPDNGIPVEEAIDMAGCSIVVAGDLETVFDSL